MQGKQESADHAVVELPRPNSGTFTTEEAELRKIEILSNKPSGKLVAWKNPYSGFSVHIHQDDSITVYGLTAIMEAVLESAKERSKQSVDDLEKLVDAIPLFGNPAGILITSDRPLKESKIFSGVLAATFASSIQLFYATASDDPPAAELKVQAK